MTAGGRLKKQKKQDLKLYRFLPYKKYAFTSDEFKNIISISISIYHICKTVPFSGLVFTSQSCVVDPLLDFGLVHQHSKGVSEEQLARARLETPFVILYDWNTVLKRTRRRITPKQHLLSPSGFKQKKKPLPALCHCPESGRLWDWFAHVLYKAVEMLCEFFYACQWVVDNKCKDNEYINVYQAWSPKTAFQHSEGSCLSGPWRSHWLQPSASSRGQTKIKWDLNKN